MRTSHAPSNINPRTPNHRTAESHPRTNGKTSRNHQNDPRMQIEITALAWQRGSNNGYCNAKTASNTKESTTANKSDQQYRTRFGTRRHTRNRHTAKPTKLCRIPEHCHNDRCVLALPIRIPNAECHGEDNWAMHCRRHDKTCIFANINLIR